jgi:uncharacterized protein YceK
MKCRMILLALLASIGLSGCASYNEHIDKCHGSEAGTLERVGSYMDWPLYFQTPFIT